MQTTNILFNGLHTFSLVPGHVYPGKSDPGDTEQGRLPVELTPLHYTVVIQPDIYTFQPPYQFTGNVSIRFQCLQLASQLYLNSFGLTIPLETLRVYTAPDSPVPAPDPIVQFTSTDTQRHFYIVFVNQFGFQPGAEYIVNMTFSGFLGTNQGGLRHSTFLSQGIERLVQYHAKLECSGRQAT